MDIKISGSGQLAAGEYDAVKISGSAMINGYTRCKSFHCSGSTHSVEDLECENEMKVSGSCKFDKNVKSESISISGAIKSGGDITAIGEISTSGGLKCNGSVKAGKISISGAAKIKGDMEAETIKISGVIDCGGLMNAEDVDIRFDKSGMRIGSIGGSRISIYSRNTDKGKVKLPLFSSLIRSKTAVTVENSIEGDSIAIEGVVTPRVSGRIVAIGDGCEIDLVQYSEQIEISPNAKVGKTEKI